MPEAFYHSEAEMSTSHGPDDLPTFAQDLRRPLASTGQSIRSLATKANYSRTALSYATNGVTLPTLSLTMAYVKACDGDPAAWERRWRDLHESLDASPLPPVVAAPPWPAEPLADGSNPECAGSSADALTVHSRKVARAGSRHILGVVELRYSARTHAAWGRFEGYGSLDHLATHKHDVEIDIGVFRGDHLGGEHYRDQYSFDYHWSGLLLTTNRTVWAVVSLYFDRTPVATGQTDRILLA